jgi:hypothetical protein
MASAAPVNLPLFYNGLQPLSSTMHGSYKTRSAEAAPFLARTHAVPITIDEFISAQRHYPIVFSVGDNPVPLALMGLNEGVNVFVDDEGKLLGETYVPAYIRRYPFMLARTTPNSEELSLCFDPESGLVGDYEEGNALFTDGQLNDTTNAILKFCEEFELSAQRTGAFMKELQNSGLLIDGEASVQVTGMEQPFVYRGFQMVAEEKTRDLRGDELRKMNQNGILQLVLAHLFSLTLVPEIFSRQVRQGKGPHAGVIPQMATA